MIIGEQIHAILNKWMKPGISIRKVTRSGNSIKLFLTGVAGRTPKTAVIHDLGNGSYRFCHATMSVVDQIY